MRSMFVLIALLGMTLAASLNMHHIVNTEVQTLLTADPTMMEDACTDRCDSIFDLVDTTDEAATDKLCADACHKALGPTTTHQPHTHHHGHTHQHHTHAPTTAMPATVA